MQKNLLSELPSPDDYRTSTRSIVRFFQSVVQYRAFVVYGSAVSPKRITLGTSDIDLFVIENEAKIPPFQALQEFGGVLAEIHQGISVQTNWQTSQTLESILRPGNGYLLEVQKGAKSRMVSRGFLSRLPLKPADLEEDYAHEDILMLRHFYRKIVSATANIRRARKNTEYAEVVRLYESYKKLFSVFAVAVRLLGEGSVFEKPKKEMVRAAVRTIGADLDEELLIHFAKRLSDFPNTLHRFQTSRLSEVQKEFEPLYAEFEKAYIAIISLPIQKRVQTVLSLSR